MPNFVQIKVRIPESRIKSGLRDPRTWELYDAAQLRLATKDYEQISIAEISRGAGCSVGAFYGRFRDKDTFLQLVIAQTFLTLTEEAKRDLDPEQWRNVSRTDIVYGIVLHISN
jgi:AcrR family transcriptional regulator